MSEQSGVRLQGWGWLLVQRPRSNGCREQPWRHSGFRIWHHVWGTRREPRSEFGPGVHVQRGGELRIRG